MLKFIKKIFKNMSQTECQNQIPPQMESSRNHVYQFPMYGSPIKEYWLYDGINNNNKKFKLIDGKFVEIQEDTDVKSSYSNPPPSETPKTEIEKRINQFKWEIIKNQHGTSILTLNTDIGKYIISENLDTFTVFFTEISTFPNNITNMIGEPQKRLINCKKIVEDDYEKYFPTRTDFIKLALEDFKEFNIKQNETN